MPSGYVLKAKVCIVGEGGVGKTSLIRRFAYDQFDDKYLKTVGTKVTKAPLRVMHSKGEAVDVDMVLFDIMGQRGFREMVKDTFFLGAQGVIAVCDATRPETVPALGEWVSTAVEVAGPVPVVYLANKTDLPGAHVSLEDLAAAASGTTVAGAYLTSAKTSVGVLEAFEVLASGAVERAFVKREAPAPKEDDLPTQFLIALARRGALGMKRRDLLDAFPKVPYAAMEELLQELEREGLIQLNWLGPGDFRAHPTPRGRESVRSYLPLAAVTETDPVL